MTEISPSSKMRLRLSVACRDDEDLEQSFRKLVTSSAANIVGLIPRGGQHCDTGKRAPMRSDAADQPSRLSPATTLPRTVPTSPRLPKEGNRRVRWSRRDCGQYACPRSTSSMSD